MIDAEIAAGIVADLFKRGDAVCIVGYTHRHVNAFHFNGSSTNAVAHAMTRANMTLIDASAEADKLRRLPDAIRKRLRRNGAGR